jgi:hypothetical protein
VQAPRATPRCCWASLRGREAEALRLVQSAVAEGPPALASQSARPGLCPVLCAEGDWYRAEREAAVTQAKDSQHGVKLV